MTVIVDYHTGNISSIKNMLARIGHPATIVNRVDELIAATRIILPGVGTFDYGMTKLAELGLLDALNKKVLDEKVPVLGICLGAQLMCESSEEGKLAGLRWIKGQVKKFPNTWEGRKIIVPHMGWDYVNSKPSKLFSKLEKPRFYFAQSYFIHCENRDEVLATNQHGTTFDAAFEKGNLAGVQFHPEKSHIFGMGLLRNFIELY